MENQQPQVEAPSNGNGAPPEEPAALATVPQQSTEMASPFAAGGAAFESAQRMAKALAASSLVPAVYRGNVANCLIAMELASRIGVSVLAAMQNLDVIQGKPSWSSKFLIATVNASQRFSPLRFEWAGTPGQDSWACRAYAADRATGERLEGTWITWLMARKEGWSTKNGSKWQTMPELMFQYRAAAFWARVFCPEISVGFHTSEELHDQHGTQALPVHELPAQLSPGGAESLEAVLGMQKAAADAPAEAELVETPPVAAEPVQGELIDSGKGKRGK